MINYANMIFTFLISFIFTFATTPIVRRLAYRIGAVDVPKDKRRVHKRPTPRIGGLAIIFGFMVAVCCFNNDWSRSTISILIGAAILGVLGVIDDCKELDAKLKFLVQIAAALVVVLYGNLRISVISNPNVFSETPYLVLPTWLSITVTVIWIVFMTNAVNFIDGLDGLAAGVSAIMSMSLVFIAITYHQYSLAIMGIALMGSCFGFLPFNFNPAKIFMGDTGSTFLGFMLAVLSVKGVFKSYAVISFAVPILMLGLPLFDATFAMIRRIISGKSPMVADRGHLHHRLFDMGFSQKQTVFILYAISGVLGITAILLAEQRFLRAMLLLMGVLIFLLIATLFGKNTFVHKVIHKNDSASSGENVEKRISAMWDKNRKLKVMTVFGTRPEAIKMCPLVLELKKHPDTIEPIVCVTAQHRQMLDQVLEIFDVKPDYDLDIMKTRQSLTGITTRVLEGFEEVLKKEQPDIVLVHGDTSTSFVAGLAAFYQQIKVGHVEAGLRTYDIYSPYPEEMNRQLTGRIADLHFAPTIRNYNNLIKENVGETRIYITGNTVIDALKTTVKDDYEFRDECLRTLDYENKRVIIVTAHRRENLGKPLEDICTAIKEIVTKYTDTEVVYPVHLNPAVRDTVWGILGETERVHLIDPLDTDELHNAISRSFMVMTDSGGIQEEAPALAKPVLVLRRETERPEAVEAGTVKLAGVDKDTIVKMASELLDSKKAYDKMAQAANPYGDGEASRRITEALMYEFGLTDKKPDTFA